MLPFRNGTGHYLEQRVDRRHRNLEVATIDLVAAARQLTQQPVPFVLQLGIRGRNASDGDSVAKFGMIEAVAAPLCFRAIHGEVTVDSGARRRARTKPP